MEQIYLTQEELKKIQETNADFTKMKMALGDLEMQKYNMIVAIEKLRFDFASYEKELIAKYGEDSVINVQTGEVNKKS